MPIGFWAFLNFERPDPSLIEAYQEIPSNNIGDCVKRMNSMFSEISFYNRINLLCPALENKPL